jgi:hypothetical protein
MPIDWSGRTSLVIIVILTLLGLAVWVGVVFLA